MPGALVANASPYQETDLRKRIAGKHVEVAATTIESVQLPAALAAALRERLDSEAAWEREKRELEHNVERRRLQRAADGVQ